MGGSPDGGHWLSPCPLLKTYRFVAWVFRIGLGGTALVCRRQRTLRADPSKRDAKGLCKAHPSKHPALSARAKVSSNTSKPVALERFLLDPRIDLAALIPSSRGKGINGLTRFILESPMRATDSRDAFLWKGVSPILRPRPESEIYIGVGLQQWWHLPSVPFNGYSRPSPVYGSISCQGDLRCLRRRVGQQVKETDSIEPVSGKRMCTLNAPPSLGVNRQGRTLGFLLAQFERQRTDSS